MNGTIPPVPGKPLQPPTSGLAIWSLVLGILGIATCFLSLVCAIPAIVCGHIALSRINKSGGALAGQGLAIAGLVLGYLGILWIPLLAAIAIPNFVKARQVSMQNACINNLRVIDSAKNEWALEHQKRTGDVPTAQDLTPYFKNGAFPVCPADGTYTIGPVGENPACSVPGHKLPP